MEWFTFKKKLFIIDKNGVQVGMRIYIVEEEQASINKLQGYIEKYAKKIGVSIDARGFTDPREFLQTYEKSAEKPYLVILEIDMKDMSGMEIAHKLREQGSDVRLIFTDTTDAHAIQAFDVQADGYLEKPVSYQNFAKAMSRFRARFAMESHTIQIRSDRKIIDLYTADIYYAEVTGHSVWVYSKRGDYKASVTMGKLVELLEGEKSFLPCGRSYLVNMTYIENLENDVIVMINGSRIPIPVRIRKDIAEQYQKYCEEYN